MSQGLTFTIHDTASPALAEFMANNTPARIAARLGPPVAELFRRHLAALPSKSGFYEKFADRVLWFPTATGLEIVILPAVINGRTVGLGLRIFGGTITAQTVKMLAVPISDAARGHVPSDFPNAFLLVTKKGAYLVQYGEGVSPGGRTTRRLGKKKQGGSITRLRANLNFLFILLASVTQAGDRNVLPSEQQITDTASKAALRLN